jgi:hypothetical protein
MDGHRNGQTIDRGHVRASGVVPSEGGKESLPPAETAVQWVARDLRSELQRGGDGVVDGLNTQGVGPAADLAADLAGRRTDQQVGGR